MDRPPTCPRACGFTRAGYGELVRRLHDAWDRPVREERGLAQDGGLAPVGASLGADSQGAAVERAFDAAGHLVRERRLQDWIDGRDGRNALPRALKEA